MGIKAKQSLEGKLNNAKEYVYPELEDLEVTPSMETQNFKSSKYGYDDVKVNAINSQQLTVSPTKASQTHTGLYDTVNVNGSSDLEAQNIVRGKTIFGVSGTFDGVDTSDADAISGDIKMTKTAYVNGVKLTGTLEEDYAKFVQDDGDGNDVVCYIYKPDLEEGDLEDIEHIFDSNSSLVETLLEIAESGADDIEDVITAIDVSTMQDIISLTDIVYNLYLYRDTLIKIIIEATSETTLDIYNMTVAYEPYEVTVALEEDVAIGETTVVIGYVTKLIIPTGTTQITENGTYDVSEYESAEINVEGSGKWVVPNGMQFENSTPIEFPELDTSNVSNFTNMFLGCTTLQTITLDGSSAQTFNGTFQYCSELVTVSIEGNGQPTDVGNMFSGCSKLENIPIIDTSKIVRNTGMVNMFVGCGNLSNESLNKILLMCANSGVTKTSSKRLSYIGLSQTQATTCTTLSNWQAFVSAGWTT